MYNKWNIISILRGGHIMATAKYNSLSPQDKCLVDAGVSEVNRLSQENRLPFFDNEKLDIIKEAASRPDVIKQVEGYAHEGKAPWAKCLPKP
jgi:hypothetical protein